MATSEQIKTLIRSHYSDQREQFSTVALQVAAHEALQGHQSVALEIRKLVDGSRLNDYKKMVQVTSELENLIRIGTKEVKFAELVISSKLKSCLERILIEYRERAKLARFGMSYRRKILLAGPPGTGKTMTASVLSTELSLPLYIIQFDKIVTKFMGETSAKLRLVFDEMKERKGVYLFDEFDAIGGERTKDNDVGEMRRVLNSFLQFIETDASDSLIICATNNPGLLDNALFRRFDDVLEYELPDLDLSEQVIVNRLGMFLPRKYEIEKIRKAIAGMSHAEIARGCEDAIKRAILADKNRVTSDMLLQSMSERVSARRASRRKNKS